MPGTALELPDSSEQKTRLVVRDDPPLHAERVERPSIAGCILSGASSALTNWISASSPLTLVRHSALRHRSRIDRAGVSSGARLSQRHSRNASVFFRSRSYSHVSTGEPTMPETLHASQLGWYPAHRTRNQPCCSSTIESIS